MNISKLDFDWRSLLIKRYKNYGLNENDIAVIFCINEIIKEKKYLVLADDIEPLMTLKKEEIDNIYEEKFPKKAGIYINEKDREKIVNYLNNNKQLKNVYKINEDGLIEISKKEEVRNLPQ